MIAAGKTASYKEEKRKKGEKRRGGKRSGKISLEIVRRSAYQE